MRPRAVWTLGWGLVWSVLAAVSVTAAPRNGAADGEALLNALREHDDARAAVLVEQGPDVNARDENGSTPLMRAVQDGSLVLASHLLRAGADPNMVSATGLGPLQLAIANHSGAIVRLLLDCGAKARVARDDGETALMTAARTGQLDVMAQLIAQGADVNAHESNFNQTALMWSAGYPAEVDLLLDHGANIRARTKRWRVTTENYGVGYGEAHGEYVTGRGDQSALFFAVQADDVESTRALLNAGADVNETAADGSTVLLLALYKWADHVVLPIPFQVLGGKLPFAPNVQIANLLLDRGAKVSIANSEGYTPLHGAALGLVGAEPAMDPKQGIALVSRLLELNADANAVTRYLTAGPIGATHVNPTPRGSSPVHIAALSGDVDLMEALLAHGGDPNLLREDGHTPLSIAVKANDLPMVKALIAHGAEITRVYSPTDLISDPAVNGANSESAPRSGQTILHIAAVAGAYKVVEFLAEHGAALAVRNSKGETPLALAAAQEKARYQVARNLEDNFRDSDFEVPHAIFEARTSEAIAKALHSAKATR